jgi:superoxide reductase
MTEEHHIAWIVAVDGNRTQRVVLSGVQEPAADFLVGGDPVTVYAYCNLHGLWAAQL